MAPDGRTERRKDGRTWTNLYPPPSAGTKNPIHSKINEFASKGANSFLSEMSPLINEAKLKTDRAAHS